MDVSSEIHQHLPLVAFVAERLGKSRDRAAQDRGESALFGSILDFKPGAESFERYAGNRIARAMLN